MGIPDNEQLKDRLHGILKSANLETFTKRAARRELEKAFTLEEGDLDERKQEIADWVEEYINENEKAAEEPEATAKDGDDQSESEGEEEEEEESKPSASKSSKKAKSTSGRGWKPQWLKPALAEFVGTDQMKRTEVVKMIWDHVKTNNLQVHFNPASS
jgi:upstream activation factor subunit UAF30